MTEVSLLPPNAGALMKALSVAFAPATALPQVDLALLWDPWQAPEDRLPSLAADLGLTLWKSDWPVLKKRQVIARSIALKRRCGTRLSFEAHLGFVDATLERMRSAPQLTTTRARRTPAERQAWAAQFPELRIYAYRQRHPARALVAGSCWGGRRRAAVASKAADYAGRRATVVDAGVERLVALRVSEALSEFAVQALQAALPVRGRRFVVGRPLGRAARTSTAADRLYGLRKGSRQLDVLPPGLEPVDVAPTRVAAPATRPPGFMAGRALVGGRRFVRVSTAESRVYDSFRLLDRTKIRTNQVRPRGGCFAGSSRLGQPAYELHLDVSIVHKRPGRRLWPSRSHGVVRAHDGRPTADALAAVRAAKLGRDRVFVRTNLHRPITAGDGIPLDGTYRLGQIVRSV